MFKHFFGNTARGVVRAGYGPARPRPDFSGNHDRRVR